MNLADGSGRIRRVMKYSMGINEVKRIVSERQVLSIALDEVSLEICQPKALVRYGQRRVRQVYRRVMASLPHPQPISSARKPRVLSKPTADCRR